MILSGYTSTIFPDYEKDILELEIEIKRITRLNKFNIINETNIIIDVEPLNEKLKELKLFQNSGYIFSPYISTQIYPSQSGYTTWSITTAATFYSI